MGKWKKIRLISAILIAIILTFNVNVVAFTSLDTITGNSAHSDIFASDYFYATIAPSVNSFEASMIIESTPFAYNNKFGIFSSSDASVKLELFGRCASPGDSVTVNFDHNTNQAWIVESNKVTIGPSFGFYLDASERIFYRDVYYSDPLLNEDDDYQVHGLLFETSSASGIFGNPDLVVAFEDWPIGGGCGYVTDFDDMVVGLTNIASASGSGSIPEPSTILFLGFGCLAIFGYRYR